MTPKQTINWEVFLTSIFGILFTILIGFFILKLVLSGLNLATSYGEKDAYKKFVEVITSSIKGLVIALGAWYVLNTIFVFLNITQITNPLNEFKKQACLMETCIRNYDLCGTQGNWCK
jgi:hypothetical protein